MSVVFGNSSGQIWSLVQRAMRDAGFKAAPAHVAILDKGQRSVKGLNSGLESVVTVDLILTVQKPAKTENAADARELRNGDTQRLITEAVTELSGDDRTPSHVYAVGTKLLLSRRTKTPPSGTSPLVWEMLFFVMHSRICHHMHKYWHQRHESEYFESAKL